MFTMRLGEKPIEGEISHTVSGGEITEPEMVPAR